MKSVYLFAVAFLMSLTLVACDEKSSTKEDIFAEQIYYFYQPTCPHCHDAIGYIDQAYPNIKMTSVDITVSPENYDLFVKCAQKHNLGNQIGTPLFCMGEHYVMGWSEEQQRQFDAYVKEFIK